MQYETLVKDDAEMCDGSDWDYARMPFELRAVEAALDVVSVHAASFSRCSGYEEL